MTATITNMISSIQSVIVGPIWLEYQKYRAKIKHYEWSYYIANVTLSKQGLRR